MPGCATCLHKNVHPNVCSDCLGGTHFLPRKFTNADRIRAMSDEELAELLDVGCDLARNGTCPNAETPLMSCRECWLDWLIQEEVQDG